MRTMGTAQGELNLELGVQNAHVGVMAKCLQTFGHLVYILLWTDAYTGVELKVGI